MARKKPGRAKQKTQKVIERPTRQWRPTWLGKVVSIPIAILSILAAAMTFLPRISVSISDPHDPLNTFSSTMTITNSGYIPLRNVFVSLAVREICGSATVCPDSAINPDPRRYQKEGHSTITEDGWVSHDLGLDDKVDVPFDTLMQRPKAATENPIQFADVAIEVSYTFPLIPWASKKLFPLYTKPDQNGVLHWVWG